MLRLHFTESDLARTFVDSVDPLWETLLSGFRLRERDRLPIFEPWIRRIRSDQQAQERMRPGATLLATLAPTGPYFPDFLTPADSGGGLGEGLFAVAATSRTELRAQLERLDDIAPLPGSLRGLADGDRELLTRVTRALGDYYQAAIGGVSDLVRGAVDADRSLRAQQFLAGGVDAVLAGIGPVVRWHYPVLEVRHDVDQDLYLHGRGLRLVPSFFCGTTACTLADPALPPVLVYPIDPSCRWLDALAGGDPLQALIGRTRTAVLAATGAGASTTDLANRVGTSTASASRHATVLRACGLLNSRRDGSAVVHTLTPLGEALLEHARQS